MFSFRITAQKEVRKLLAWAKYFHAQPKTPKGGGRTRKWVTDGHMHRSETAQPATQGAPSFFMGEACQLQPRKENMVCSESAKITYSSKALNLIHEAVLENSRKKRLENLIEVSKNLLSEVQDARIAEANKMYYVMRSGPKTATKSKGRPLSNAEEERHRQVYEALDDLHKKYLKEERSSTHFLLLNAPINTACFTMDAERESGEKQLKDFFRSACGGSESNHKATHKTILQADDIDEIMEEFFKKSIMDCSMIMIVFNGHGFVGDDQVSRGSLAFHEGDLLSMEDFVTKTKKIWKKTVEDHAESDSVLPKTSDMQLDSNITPESTLPNVDISTNDRELVAFSDATPVEEQQDLNQTPRMSVQEILDQIPPVPSEVRIVFAQCYAHEFSQENREQISPTWGSKMRIVALTSLDRDDGEGVYNADFATSGDLISTSYPLLEEYAEKVAKRVKEQANTESGDFKGVSPPLIDTNNTPIVITIFTIFMFILYK